MSLTLGLTGMDPATETALKATFAEANARLDGRWQLLPEAEATHVMVDMDSMYGPMSWLRLHAAGKRVVGLSTAPRTQTDFRLGRPFDSDSFTDLLRHIAADEGVELIDQLSTKARSGPGKRDADAAADAADAAPPEPALPASPPSGPTPAPAPEDQLPEEIVSGVQESKLAPPDEAQSSPDTQRVESQPAEPVAADPATSEPEPEPEPAAPAREPVFADWLMPGALSQRVRYRRESGPTVLIDPQVRQYHGPTTLKPFAPYFEGVVRREDLDDIDDAAWERESAAAGAAQPLLRLQWLGGLVAGNGALLPGYDPDGRYRLNKWPQTEREYPRHFRIATAMMKAPATLAEIAVASGMPDGDVADFINANLMTGFAEFVPEPPPEPVEPPKPSGLFGRLRGK